MRIVRTSIVVALVALLGWGIYGLMEEHEALREEVQTLREKRDAVNEENIAVKEDIEFYENPENRVKLLKEQTNMVESGENLIILIAPQELSSSSKE